MAPGVRIRISSREVRTSIGRRAARIHVGAGSTGFSTGVGPVSYDTSLRGGRSSTGGSSGAVVRSVAASTLQEQIEQLLDVYKASKGYIGSRSP